MSLLDYIFFRFYDYFKKKKEGLEMINTMIIIYITEISLLLFIYYFSSLFIELSFIKELFQENRNNKVLITIIFTLVVFVLNYIFFSPKKEIDYYLMLEKKYKKEKYKLPIWILFCFPIFFSLISFIGYGLIKGTLRFPILDNLLN